MEQLDGAKVTNTNAGATPRSAKCKPQKLERGQKEWTKKLSSG